MIKKISKNSKKEDLVSYASFSNLVHRTFPVDPPQPSKDLQKRKIMFSFQTKLLLEERMKDQHFGNCKTRKGLQKNLHISYMLLQDLCNLSVCSNTDRDIATMIFHIDKDLDKEMCQKSQTKKDAVKLNAIKSDALMLQHAVRQP